MLVNVRQLTDTRKKTSERTRLLCHISCSQITYIGSVDQPRQQTLATPFYFNSSHMRRRKPAWKVANRISSGQFSQFRHKISFLRQNYAWFSSDIFIRALCYHISTCKVYLKNRCIGSVLLLVDLKQFLHEVNSSKSLCRENRKYSTWVQPTTTEMLFRLVIVTQHNGDVTLTRFLARQCMHFSRPTHRLSVVIFTNLEITLDRQLEQWWVSAGTLNFESFYLLFIYQSLND